MIITPRPLTITQLLGGDTEQYVVPAYQRRYSWQYRHLLELWNDIDYLGDRDTHLMGSIVCLTGFHVAGINQLEVVDGQQRLTTLCVLLRCIADRFLQEGLPDDAASLRRLLQATAPGIKPQPKLLLDSLDSNELNEHLAGATLDEPTNQRLADVFYYFRDWVTHPPLEQLQIFAHRIKNQCIVVRLDVSQAKDAFKLFETINNRGLRLSPPDIIKNFILGNAARFNDGALDLGKKTWAQLLAALDGVSIEGFFRSFLAAARQQRVRTSEVIAGFKTLFMRRVLEAADLSDRAQYVTDDSYHEEDGSDEDEGNNEDGNDVEGLEDGPRAGVDAEVERVPFEQFMTELVRSAQVYGQIASANTSVPSLDRRLSHLLMIRSAQAYGFLTSLRVRGCDDTTFERVLELTEAILIRRHICKRRSNENETMFAKLGNIDAGAALEFTALIFRQYAPSDEEFATAFARYEFVSTLDRARYCLEQFELRRHGEHLELVVAGPDSVHIEHIIPQKIGTKKAKKELGDWPSYLGVGAAGKHRHYASRIGNLTLFAGPLNIGASNNPYKRKVIAYSKSSLKLTKELVADYPDFRFDEVEERSSKLAKEAVELWPLPQR